MSAADVRQALADAANTVEGVNVSPYFKQTFAPGDGMVRKDRIDYPNPFGGLVRWQVVVMLPQADMAEAERFLDDKIPGLVTALAEEMIVKDVSPAQLQVDQGIIPVALINGIREEE